MVDPRQATNLSNQSRLLSILEKLSKQTAGGTGAPHMIAHTDVKTQQGKFGKLKTQVMEVDSVVR